MIAFLRTVRAVAWSFLGVRSHGAYEDDLKRLNPLHVVFIGLLGGVVFVLVLVGIVHWVV